MIKKLLLKMFFLVFSSILLIIAFCLYPLPENSFMMAIIDKNQNLASIEGNKLVIVGGSNVIYGIDSEKIYNGLQLPVINTGMTIGFGLGRMIDNVLPFLNPGDYLLVIPEYTNFVSIWNGNHDAYHLIFVTRQFRLLFSRKYELPVSFSGYLNYRLSAIFEKIVPENRTRIPELTRDGFNNYGDYIKRDSFEGIPFNSHANIGVLNQNYLNNFSLFVKELTSRGVKVLFSYACYEEQSFNNNYTLIQELDYLLRNIENLHVISKPLDYSFPMNFFYDTAYHLLPEGRNIRTDLLIRDLKEINDI